MGQELGLDRQAGVFVLSDRFADMGGIPVNDDGGEQPDDDEERSFDPSDFAESDGQFVLARRGRNLSQQLARRKGAAGQGGSNLQDVWPVPHDHVLPDFVAGQSDQGFRNGSGFEDMQPFRRQVPDAAVVELGLQQSSSSYSRWRFCQSVPGRAAVSVPP